MASRGWWWVSLELVGCSAYSVDPLVACASSYVVGVVGVVQTYDGGHRGGLTRSGELLQAVVLGW